LFIYKVFLLLVMASISSCSDHDFPDDGVTQQGAAERSHLILKKNIQDSLNDKQDYRNLRDSGMAKPEVERIHRAVDYKMQQSMDNAVDTMGDTVTHEATKG